MTPFLTLFTEPPLYTIEERDQSSAKADRSLIGTFWRVSRRIYRVGYEFEPPLMPPDEVTEEEDHMLLSAFRLAILQHRDLEGESMSLAFSKDRSIRLVTRDLAWPPEDKLTKEEEQLAKNLLRIFRARKFPGPTWKAKGQLAERKRLEAKGKADWRRFWYLDTSYGFPYYEYVVVRITETKRFVTGEWYPASGGYDPEWGDSDYEPGGLNPAYHQNVYQVAFYEHLKKGWVDRFLYEPRYVHPDDLMPLTEKDKIVEE